MLQTLDPANRARRLIPLLKEKCELPLEIRYLTYVDFTRPDRLEIAWTQLLTALGAPPVQEAPLAPTREGWHLAHSYPMPPSFTGRVAERAMLSRWLDGDPARPLLVLRAMGGFGKSALAWHWLLHDVDPARWPRVVWWCFYDERSCDVFLRETLAYLGVDPRPLGPRQQADALLRLLHQPGTLLVLDGFERALRAYGSMMAAYQGDRPLPQAGGGTDRPRSAGEGAQRDCISPLAEHLLRGLAALPGIRAKALITTRLTPRALELPGGILLQGCREEALTQMQPADATAFFRAQGVRGARAEIERACAPYGYHPLSLRLLAGLIARDPRQPGDVAAARRLDVAGDQVSRQHHVLEQAYENLAPARRELLGQIACFRGPVRYETLQSLAAQPKKRGIFGRLFGSRGQTPITTTEESLQADLRDLVARGLLHHDRQTKHYDLHPIVRRYAYDRLGDREGVHSRLRDYFAALPPPDRVGQLEDLAPAVELYHHTVRAGQYDEAVRLLRDRLVPNPLYFQFGAYQLCIELLRALFPDGEDQPPRLKEEGDQAWTLNELANSYSLSGQPRRAVPLFEQHNAIYEKRDDKRNLAIGLGNLAYQQMGIGALRAAEANLRRRVALCREIEDESEEAVGHQELGRLLAYRGAWAEAGEELEAALALFEKHQEVQSQCVVWAYRALRALLMARAGAARTPSPLPTLGEGPGVRAALHAARRALELADETARTRYPVERDYVDAHWLLGAAHRANGAPLAADRHLSEALTRCRGISAVDAEADILLDLARLRAEAGEREEALRLAGEAQLITERSGYVLQGADVRLFLARMAVDAGDRATALEHARQARRLATCDGPPDYTYKVAYEEAGALLEELTKDE